MFGFQGLHGTVFERSVFLMEATWYMEYHNSRIGSDRYIDAGL